MFSNVRTTTVTCKPRMNCSCGRRAKSSNSKNTYVIRRPIRADRFVFLFLQQLREVEAKKLYELMEAFKEKDRERESLLQKKVSLVCSVRTPRTDSSLQMKEYGELEKQMKKALADIEKREKQLHANEQEVNGLPLGLASTRFSPSRSFNACKSI